MFHFALIIDILILLAFANGSPIVAKRIIGDRLSQPVDGGILLYDSQRLFGSSKTVRGIVVAIASTTLAAILIGWPWTIGLVVGACSMVGDLLSSFIKRRLSFPQSTRATGIDQVPESLMPGLACIPLLGLSAADVVAIVLIFFVGSVVLSRWLYRFGLRDQPH